MNHWQPDFLNKDKLITAVDAGHPIYPDRINDWKEFYKEYHYLPSILLTESGWMVNGHHRLKAAQELNAPLHGLIVEYKHDSWVATGNICRVA